VKILKDISAALTHIAVLNICHNDIKPGNIAFSPSRGAVLLDFGLASYSQSKALGGTPWYIPPEYYSLGLCTSPGDVWALGITMLYTLGFIMLPDCQASWWHMAMAQQKVQPHHKYMVSWMRTVQNIRTIDLDRGNTIHSLVIDMLEPREDQRITAAQIHARLNELSTPQYVRPSARYKRQTRTQRATLGSKERDGRYRSRIFNGGHP
jgi:serine/threonine protein kinase